MFKKQIYENTKSGPELFCLKGIGYFIGNWFGLQILQTNAGKYWNKIAIRIGHFHFSIENDRLDDSGVG